MRTDAPDGLVSWLGLDQAQEDYLGLGLDDGLVKVLYLTLCPGFFDPEHVFLNVYGAQESIPRNEFRQPMYPGGPVR